MLTTAPLLLWTLASTLPAAADPESTDPPPAEPEAPAAPEAAAEEGEAPAAEEAPAPEAPAAAAQPEEAPAPVSLDEEPAKEAKKPKQWRWAALPIANYTSTYGLGYGAYANIVNNGKNGSGDDPYKASFSAQFYQTTGSYYDHFFKVDFPGMFGSEFRLDAQFGLTNWDTANWFGYGNNTARYLTDECPTDPAEEKPAAGCTPYLYYNYHQSGLKLISNLRRTIKGPWSAFLGLRVQQFNIDDYAAGETPKLGKDPQTVTEDSLVTTLQPFGVQGGLYVRAGLGAMYDTRDQEPSPTGGMWTEASVRWGGMVTNETGSNIGVNITDRRFWGFGQKKRLVLASRVILDMKWGEEPIFMGHVYGGSQDVSLGSSTAMRGLPNSRYQGDGALLWTPEMRWKVLAIDKRNSFDIMLGPYFDVGRVWLWPDAEDANPGDDDTWSHLHYAGGLATRYVWNTNMVIRLDVGFGREELVNLETQERVYEPNLGINLVFDHPF